MEDFKEAGHSIEWNSEIINRIVRAHLGSTNLSVDDVKVIFHKNLEKFWKFAVRQSAFQVFTDNKNFVIAVHCFLFNGNTTLIITRMLHNFNR